MDTIEKAKKGTPAYEAWIAKYRAKRGEQPSLFEGQQGPKKSTAKDLLSKPPKFVKDKEVWAQAVNKITQNGKNPASYGACVALYKRKLEKQSKLPAQMREDDVDWEKALKDTCQLWVDKFSNARLAKAKKGTPQYEAWLEKFKAKRSSKKPSEGDAKQTLKEKGNNEPAGATKESVLAADKLLREYVDKKFSAKGDQTTDADERHIQSTLDALARKEGIKIDTNGDSANGGLHSLRPYLINNTWSTRRQLVDHLMDKHK